MILRGPHEARVAAVATAFGGHAVGRDETLRGLLRLFPDENPGFLANLVDRSGVETRHFVIPSDEIIQRRSFTDRNGQYREIAAGLAGDACRTALDRAGVRASDIDVLIDVSCTGFIIPALDTFLSPALGLRPDVRRIPITESGCAGGAVGLGLAATLAEAGQRVLVVAVELCSLAFVQGDRSRTNIVAGILFGDGAGAAVVTREGEGPRFRAVGSHLFPESHGAMGYDVGDHGFRLILQRELPDVLKRALRPAIEDFLRRHESDISRIDLHLLHPGGKKVLDVYGGLFGLDESALRYSFESLKRYGNLSSVSILTVLELALAAKEDRRDWRNVLLLAFGPGLSAEMSLLSFAGA
jgi:alkylresorcinol/alkylpyrone synthase